MLTLQPLSIIWRFSDENSCFSWPPSIAGKNLFLENVEHKLEYATFDGERTDFLLGHFFLLSLDHSATSIADFSLPL